MLYDSIGSSVSTKENYDFFIDLKIWNDGLDEKIECLAIDVEHRKDVLNRMIDLMLDGKNFCKGISEFELLDCFMDIPKFDYSLSQKDALLLDQILSNYKSTVYQEREEVLYYNTMYLVKQKRTYAKSSMVNSVQFIP